MEVKFCGASRRVTGSSHLITLDNGYRILLDCGLNQGKGRDVWDLNNKWYFDPASIDCLILSHAHIDHSGRIPQLVKDGFKGNIYCTHATRSLCAIMLLDSAKIQERDVEWYNKKILKKRKKSKHQLRVPLYVSENVPPAMDLFVGFGYNRWYRISDHAEVLFRDAGHILGSASVTLKLKENGEEIMFGFTGDIGRPERPILRDPQMMPEVDYLICESTYGDKLHDSAPAQHDKFLNCIVKTCIDKKGKLIVPAFSVGRTQEIVYMLDQLENEKRLPKLPVYVDSPLAVNATQVFGSHPECFDQDLSEYLLIDENPFGFNDLNYVRDVNGSKRLNSKKDPCVIISASGMMNAGRIKHHLYNNIENPKNTFLIVGYCSPGTPGHLLRNGAEEIRVFGDVKKVKADIDIMYSFSAHGDQNEMYDFIRHQKQRAKKIFLVHGEYDTQKDFKYYLQGKGFKDVIIPDLGHKFHLS